MGLQVSVKSQVLQSNTEKIVLFKKSMIILIYFKMLFYYLLELVTENSSRIRYKNLMQRGVLHQLTIYNLFPVSCIDYCCVTMDCLLFLFGTIGKILIETEKTNGCLEVVIRRKVKPYFISAQRT